VGLGAAALHVDAAGVDDDRPRIDPGHVVHCGSRIAIGA
jgi:hypothetical protein